MGTIFLDTPPNSVDATNPPGMLHENDQWIMLMDDSTDEPIYYSFRMPSTYGTALTLKFRYKMDTATSGNVIVRCAIRATADGEDPASSGFHTDNFSGATAVPGTAEQEDEISISLANSDSVAAGESCTVRIARDADNGSDTATGDMKMLPSSIEFTDA